MPGIDRDRLLDAASGHDEERLHELLGRTTRVSRTRRRSASLRRSRRGR